MEPYAACTAVSLEGKKCHQNNMSRVVTLGAGDGGRRGLTFGTARPWGGVAAIAETGVLVGGLRCKTSNLPLPLRRPLPLLRWAPALTEWGGGRGRGHVAVPARAAGRLVCVGGSLCWRT